MERVGQVLAGLGDTPGCFLVGKDGCWRVGGFGRVWVILCRPDPLGVVLLWEVKLEQSVEDEERPPEGQLWSL